LATLEKLEASAVGNYTIDSYKGEIEFSDPSLAGLPSDVSFSQSHPSFNFASIASPLVVGDRNLVLAAGYQRLLDLYSSLEYSHEWDSAGTDPVLGYWEAGYHYNYTFEQKGGVGAISPATAIQITPEVSLGATFNIWTGSSKIQEKQSESLYARLPDLAWDTSSVWDTTLTAVDFDYSGFNVNLGVLARLEKFSIGAVAKTPLTLKEKFNVEGTDYINKYKFPFTFGFGAAVMPTENLTLAADVDIRPYSNTDLSNDTTITDFLEDGTQFRVGLEYLVIQDFGVLPLRLGFRTDPWLSKGFDDEKVTGLVFTGGAGLMIGNVWLDAAYELGMAKTEGDHEDFDGDGIGDRVTFKQTTHNIMLSAVIHFEPFR